MSERRVSDPPKWGTQDAALCWYDFKSGASKVSTTGALADDKKYDYIVCYDPQRPGAELFAELSENLAPGGRLLLALDNKYGLKYWCGARGGASGRPFGEIEGGDTLLSGVQLRRELNKAGFLSQKWYYPTPDHRYIKAVYSDNHLPDPYFTSISPINQTNGTGVLLREVKIFPGIIENGAFTFMCNSFIVEAAREPDAVMCPVDFAALTLYRPPDRAFITAVYADGTAKKTAVYPKGGESLQKLSENHTRLIKHGLEAVPIILEGGSATMPAVHHGILWDYMQSLARNGCFTREEFLRIFDRIRDDILKSSELSPPGSHGCDPQLGPVLRHAYTEMVPANCFYDKAREMFIYFDQEHALENCPYSVPLSRALMSITYSAELSSHPEIIEFLQELKKRYGLLNCWDKLVEIEREFVAHLYGTDDAREYEKNAAAANAEIAENRNAHNLRAAVVLLLKKYKAIGLYGYGKRGRAFETVLMQLGRQPAFTADKNTGGLKRDFMADVIVVTPKKGADEIAAQLRRETSVPVITLEEIFFELE